MAHWKNLANYDYLGAYSLEGVPNNEVILTIKEVKKERVTAAGGASEDCIVATFYETGVVNGVEVKPMVLNKTNCKTIEDIYKSGDIDNWIGKPIAIFATTTKFARDIVPCLRVKKELPHCTCSVCGKEIEPAIYGGSVKKYGIALCSKECVEKVNGGER